MKNFSKAILFAVVFSALVPALTPAKADNSFRNIIFPVVGHVNYINDFGFPRVGHSHIGNDIFGHKMQPLVAATDGVISYVTYPEASWGWAVYITDAEGFTYRYIHMNNDTPGTDNGRGGAMFALAPDVWRGNRVVKGQLIGYMGDSGNAEPTPPHLHFEIHWPDGTAMNPYASLIAAPRLGAPVEPPPLPGEILPYGPNFKSGVDVAFGNLDSDSNLELITAPNKGGGPHIRAFETNGDELSTNFFAYHANFTSGVDIASGDVDGDGIDEIITAPQAGGGPHIKVFKKDGTEISGFMAYDPNFKGGVKIAAADLDGDKKVEIITGPASNGGPHVRVFRSDGSEVYGFMAYDLNFRGGIDVTAVSKTSSTELEILTVPASGGGPHMRTFDEHGQETKARMTFEPWWTGSYDVAAGHNPVAVSSGPGRRASIRVF